MTTEKMDPNAAQHRATVDAILNGEKPAAAAQASQPEQPAKAIELQPVDSSQIEAIGYDADTETLAVRFNGKGRPGSLYHYRGVSLTEWHALQDAPSKGSYFIRNIKPHPDRYPFTRIQEPASA